MRIKTILSCVVLLALVLACAGIVFLRGSDTGAGAAISAAGADTAVAVTPEATAEPTPVPTPEPTPQPYADGFTLCAQHYAVDTATLDLRTLTSSADWQTLEDVAPYLTSLKTVELGDETSSSLAWSDIAHLRDLLPGAKFNYSFTLYGEAIELEDETIDLRKIPVNDDGAAVVEALKCMPNCKTLDMDSCGVESTRMAEIRDQFPDVEVIWRVTFGTMGYSVRTNVKTVMASLSGTGDYAGLTNDESVQPLTYCTEIINLDLGHNSNLRTLSFLKYMPNLETFVTYEDYLRDVSDLKYAKHLRYLELYGSSMTNIDSIAELDELTDLMLCGCWNLVDISPIIGADKLPNIRRFYISQGMAPQSQIDEFAANHPNCEVNYTDNSAISSWRWIDPVHTMDTVENRTPCYRRLCEIFNYKESNRVMYNFAENDPYYTTPHGQAVTGQQVDWFYGEHHFDPYGIYGDGED